LASFFERNLGEMFEQSMVRLAFFEKNIECSFWSHLQNELQESGTPRCRHNVSSWFAGLLENYGINRTMRKFLPDLPNRSQDLGVDSRYFHDSPQLRVNGAGSRMA